MEHLGGMGPEAAGADDHQRPVADLPSVAERAVDDVATPSFGQALDGGELVHQAGRDEQASPVQDAPVAELDREAVRRVARDLHRVALDQAHAVALDLAPADPQQLERGEVLVAQVPVHVGGGGVRGRPASTTATDRRTRPRLRAALSPAAPPPTITTSTVSSGSVISFSSMAAP